MDASEFGLSNADFGLPPDADQGHTTDSAAMFALASQGALVEQQIRSRGAPRVPQPQQVYQQPVCAQPPANPALADIEHRLGLAGYYRALLEQPIFETDEEDAFLVEDEIRVFILGRLGELLGTARPAPAAPQLPFTPQQLRALSLLADALLKRQQQPAPETKPADAIQQVTEPVLSVVPSPTQNEPPTPPLPPQVVPRSPRAPRVRANAGPRQVVVPPVATPQFQQTPLPTIQQSRVIPRPARRGSQRAAGQGAVIPPAPVDRDPGRRSESGDPHALTYVDEQGEAPILPLRMPVGAAYTAITAMKAGETAASIARSGGIVHRE